VVKAFLNSYEYTWRYSCLKIDTGEEVVDTSDQDKKTCAGFCEEVVDTGDQDKKTCARFFHISFEGNWVRV